MVWPQTDCKKILAEFKFGGGASGPLIKEHVAVSHLRYLNKAMSFANLQEINSYMCSLCRGGGGRCSQEYYCMHYVITHCMQNIIGIACKVLLADFN